MEHSDKPYHTVSAPVKQEDCSHRGGPLMIVAAECIECGLCIGECNFLRNYGLPKAIAARILDGDEQLEKIGFSCSLCRLCTAVCPKQLPMAEMFLELRRRLVRRGEGRFRCHRPLRFYEWIGSSWLLSAYMLPEGCREVFFPGCALCGIRPGSVKEIVRYLRCNNPTLGVVLDCCNKPSHDLGKQMHFLVEFGRKLDFLMKRGVDQVIVGCPSCYRTFREYGGAMTVTMVYDHLDGVGDHDTQLTANSCECMVHDACSLRFEVDVHKTVRSLIARAGMRVSEMKHHGTRTLCCGEGGAAMQYDHTKSGGWQSVRRAEMGDAETVTYCAGCTVALDSPKTRHLVDLIFPSCSADAADETLPRPPRTYVNRLKLKLWLWRLFRLPT